MGCAARWLVSGGGADCPAAPPALAATSEAKAEASITNVQTQGVDEGGIVKRAGDHLVILRRGRLFTVRVGGDTLQPAAMLDAYAPDVDPRGAWYDELLISGSTVVVVGYSYARGGTEVGLFELGGDGTLAYRGTYHLRSFDYYSSRNYASRLVGHRLIFYTPTLLQPWGPVKPSEAMPGLRRRQDAQTPTTPESFDRILPATRIYRTDDEFAPGEALALHTVVGCDIGGAALRCEASAVLGPAGHVFYVARDAVYVWTTPWRDGPRPAEAPATMSAVFRLPLDGAAPKSLKTAGEPVDQMSFLEDDGGWLNVLLRESGRGDGMWGSERAQGRMALLRVPVSAFGDGQAVAGPEHYRALPGPGGYTLQNRLVGDWLLWGGGTQAWALRHAGSAPAQPLSPGHGIERIEAMGRHAVLVGNAGGDLVFSSLRLGRATAQVIDRHVESGARQGETRSHGFFFQAAGDEDGLLGLPLRRSSGGAAVTNLRQRGLALTPLGALEARASTARRPADDGCKASCVDWYGNARPIFLGDRVLALLGYELVEGRITGRIASWDSQRREERIEEQRRISFAPSPRSRNGRGWPY